MSACSRISKCSTGSRLLLALPTHISKAVGYRPRRRCTSSPDSSRARQATPNVPLRDLERATKSTRNRGTSSKKPARLPSDRLHNPRRNQ